MLATLGKSRHEVRYPSITFLRGYSLNSEGVCHRTQVAIRTQTLNCRDWEHYVQGRDTLMEAVDHERKADAWICRQILMPYHNDVVQALKCFQEDNFGRPTGVTDPMRSVLRHRWIQIEMIIRHAFSNGINQGTRTESQPLIDASEGPVI